MEKVYKENYFEWMSRISKQSNWEITCWVVFLGVLIGAPWGGGIFCYKFFFFLSSIFKVDISFFQNVIDLVVPSCVAWYMMYAVYYSVPRFRIPMVYFFSLVFIIMQICAIFADSLFLNSRLIHIFDYRPSSFNEIAGFWISAPVCIFAVFRIKKRYLLMLKSQEEAP